MSKRYITVILFLFTFSILQYTAYPLIGWWDSGEYAVISTNLSVPGPGGSILFVLLGWLSTKLFFFITPIKAITLVSIISTALSSVFFYYTILMILKKFSEKNELAKITISFIIASSIPFLYSIWQEAHVSREYALGLLLTSILIFCTFSIWLMEDNNKKVKYFLLLVFIMGLDFSAHRLNSPFIPIIFILIFLSLRNNLLNFKFWFAVIFLYFMGLSVHSYLLVRSQSYPLLDMGNTHTFQQLFSWIKMEQYGSELNILNLFKRKAPLWAYQIKFMYLRYFSWNFLGIENSGNFLSFLSKLSFILGSIGFIYSLFRKFKIWILIFITFLLYSIILILYLNVQAGFHNVREIDRLFIPSFYIFTIWVSIGLYFIFVMIDKLINKINFNRKIVYSVVIIIAILILPLNMLISNWDECNKNKYYFPVDFAYNILSSCEENAVLFTNGDNDTYPLWYLQYVEGYRNDVCVANLSLLNLRSYVEQITKKPFYFPIDSTIMKTFDFKPSTLGKPELIEIIPSVPINFSKDTLKFTYTGRKMWDKNIITTQDMILLSFLKENKLKRPVYFSSTVASANLIGLKDYLHSVGIINKLLPFKGDEILPNEMGKNLTEVYRYRYFNDRDVRLDEMTRKLYNNFRTAFLKISNYYIKIGNKQNAKKMFDIMNDKLPLWRFSETQNESIKKFGELLQQ
jgi:hypothetical protein